MSNPAQRTLQSISAEYYQMAAVIGEKVGQIKSLEADIDRLANDLKNLFLEIGVYKAAQQATQPVQLAQDMSSANISPGDH